MKLKTINILQTCDHGETIIGLFSFSDTPSGEREAEKLFTQLATQQEGPDMGPFFTPKEIKLGWVGGELSMTDGWALMVINSS